ncbi:YtpI family protein [Bacillus sp. DTU_2020_1000418_1_SI_GHA_SEK_038]|uniref:YtpI family protein n=1 Tax=Bacillus sp. DTU_2020_1000418_1_SI_GHA_SEK_038 TaxID=3077585 RepID=UPI0028EA5C19|nr:YtpI family protein [Bacillus sp. DTU_2020_1000418_1_SI_GHA_SEK_038]WNS74575.1 YtpI family protein [Bacillus sp. DTU_2020_1000418_1_SI_GHA_SEK_038]
MPALVILITIALSFYLYYKVKFVRCKKPAEKKWISSKSSMALGVFIGLYGLNQFFLNGNTITYIVGGVFFLLGVFTIFSGLKAYKYYLPIAANEAKE